MLMHVQCDDVSIIDLNSQLYIHFCNGIARNIVSKFNVVCLRPGHIYRRGTQLNSTVELSCGQSLGLYLTGMENVTYL